MCGIWCRIGCNTDPQDPRPWVKQLVARGPEGTRIINVTDKVTFGFTRLAINGLTEGGMQPFTRGSISWVCNGEIYNSDELRKVLISKGHRFISFSDNEVILDLQQQRLERAIGFELTNTQNVIKRSGIFDDVDRKYGISEEERAKLEAAGAAGGAPGGDMGGGMDMGGGGAPAAAAPPAGGEGPLSESFKAKSKKSKILGMLGEEEMKFTDLFDMDKAQQNIYEMEDKLNEILAHDFNTSNALTYMLEISKDLNNIEVSNCLLYAFDLLGLVYVSNDE